MHNQYYAKLYVLYQVYFDTTNNQNAWFIGVNIPSTNYGAICKICNPDLPAIKAYTDTNSLKNGIQIVFAGKLRKICSNENQTFGFTVFPETLCSYITIDSLHKQ